MTLVENPLSCFGFLLMACKSTMSYLKKCYGRLFHDPALSQLKKQKKKRKTVAETIQKKTPTIFFL